MDKSSIQCFLFILLTIIVTMISCSNAQREVGKLYTFDPEDESEFTYVRNQENGPEKWGKLKPEWKMCGKGEMQSPIDLMHKRVRIVSHLGRLTRNYKPSNATLRNRGHDMMVKTVARNQVKLLRVAVHDLRQNICRKVTEQSR
ncbi:hypothetical protein F2Q69_00040967 [Brassica cretica]|uniref:Alpha-carbonic anhydrase domain-containing protein n=1 Tax=Brassica cretica TaxID=69181 RepID=A0A8S9NJW8_BRACR|nr:hypothetical protein F2Q69_00040967 [Brassica cretica]